MKKNLIKETLERFLRKHRQTVKSPPPEFNGGYCGVAALLLGLKWLQFDETKRRNWKPLRYYGQKRRFRSEMYGVCRMHRPVTLVEFIRIFRENETFSGYGLVVIDRDKENSVVAEINKDVQHSKTIYLCVTRGHYVFVKHMRNYFGFVRRFYCKGCHRVAKVLNKHHCDLNLCRHCKCRCDSLDGFVVCDHCYRLFRGRECYEKHFKMNESPMYPKRKVCETVMACRYCWKDLAASEGVFKRNAEGSCINAYQINASKEAKKHVVFKRNVTRAIVNTILERSIGVMCKGELVYYDFETRTDIDADGSKYYTPNCCVLQLQRLKKTENITRSLSWGTIASKD